MQGDLVSLRRSEARSIIVSEGRAGIELLPRLPTTRASVFGGENTKQTPQFNIESFPCPPAEPSDRDDRKVS
jgi:hypothetical protein